MFAPGHQTPMSMSAPPPGLGPPRSGRGPGDSRRRALKLFFELRDNKYNSIVDELFRCYHFQDIAHGIWKKYRILPQGWQAELMQLKQNNDPRMSWFHVKRMRYLTETTENYPAVDKHLSFPSRGPKEELERVVDEFIVNEKSYHEKLAVFMTSYVAEVEAIAHEKVGRQAMDALGLSRQEVDFIFGETLLRVLKASETLLTTLEILSLVPAHPNIAGGRPGILSDVIVLSGTTLVQVYGPYNATYNVAKQMLHRATERLSNPQFNRLNSQPGGMRHLNFHDLWLEISQSKLILRQATIDSILIRPIQRFPNYKVFFDRLKREIPASHPAHSKVCTAYDKIIEFTQEIDEDVRHYGERENRFYVPSMG